LGRPVNSSTRASSPGGEGKAGLPCSGKFTTNHLETEIDIQERLPHFIGNFRETLNNYPFLMQSGLA
jgi:hypothetical protein